MFFTDISSERGELTRAELEVDHGSARLAFCQHDVSDCAQWSQVWFRAEEFFGGEVEVLCNNAGIYETYQSTNTNIINVNLLGVTYGSIMAMEKMSVRKGGSGGLIVQVSSMAGLVTTTASPLYCASKAGVLAYLRSHGPEYQRTNNVRMVAVCSSLTDTPLIRSTDTSDHLFKLNVQRGFAHKRGWTAHLSVRNEVTEARGGCCRTGVGGGVRASRISSHHLPRPLLLLARHKPRVVQPLLPRL